MGTFEVMLFPAWVLAETHPRSAGPNAQVTLEAPASTSATGYPQLIKHLSRSTSVWGLSQLTRAKKLVCKE